MDKEKNLPEFTDNFKHSEDLILKDHLALLRTKLANERTLFSYIRTSLYLFTAGMGILEIKSIEHLKLIAYLSLFFSGLLFVTGWFRFYQINKRLKNHVPGNTFFQGRSRQK